MVLTRKKSETTYEFGARVAEAARKAGKHADTAYGEICGRCLEGSECGGDKVTLVEPYSCFNCADT